jgi:hypothetical protein
MGLPVISGKRRPGATPIPTATPMPATTPIPAAARAALSDATMYARVALGLPAFFRRRIRPDEARALVKERLAQREANFLRLLERGVYGHPGSPYLALLRWAGIEQGDLRGLVRERGVEGALRVLRDADVYVGFEEFKGRQPIERPGLSLAVQPRDFDNPFLRRAYQAESGGSTGVGTRVEIDLEHIAAMAPLSHLMLDAHGVSRVPTAIWLGTLPDSSGILSVLLSSYLGHSLDRWFTPLTRQTVRPALKYRIVNRSFVLIARALGGPAPWPEPLRLDQARVIARWAAVAVQRHGGCVIGTLVSLAMRVCVAAREEGLDLTGVLFVAGGEPPTEAKVQEIQRSGAHWIPGYGFQEGGTAAIGCGNPVDGSDVHLCRDVFALITHPRLVPGTDITVPVFNFSSLLPTAPKLLLNVELDDYGLVEQRACGCPLEAIGYRDHLRNIHSYRKLTGEGVTLVGSDMVRILEEVLPARFGGSGLDYQLREEEDERGFTRLNLVVSPKVGHLDEQDVIAAVLEALGKAGAAGEVARAFWSQAGTLRVKREEPAWTARGKLMPLHLERQARGEGGKGQ